MDFCTPPLFLKNQKLEKAVTVGAMRSGVPEENSGKVPGKLLEFFPNREMLQILGFRAPGKANLPRTLGPCPRLPGRVFFEIDSSSLLEFYF